jgi:hypothetical protein
MKELDRKRAARPRQRTFGAKVNLLNKVEVNGVDLSCIAGKAGAKRLTGQLLCERTKPIEVERLGRRQRLLRSRFGKDAARVHHFGDQAA